MSIYDKGPGVLYGAPPRRTMSDILAEKRRIENGWRPEDRKIQEDVQKKLDEAQKRLEENKAELIWKQQREAEEKLKRQFDQFRQQPSISPEPWQPQRNPWEYDKFPPSPSKPDFPDPFPLDKLPRPRPVEVKPTAPPPKPKPEPPLVDITKPIKRHIDWRDE